MKKKSEVLFKTEHILDVSDSAMFITSRKCNLKRQKLKIFNYASKMALHVNAIIEQILNIFFKHKS